MRPALLSFSAFALLTLTTSACHHGDRVRERRDDPFVEAVYSRAQFDLACPAGQLGLMDIGGSSYGVIGCGHRASYTCICMYHVWYTCTQPLCQLNGPPMQDPTAVVQPAPVVAAPGAPPPPPPPPPH
jgi:hypothetical protein